MDSRGRLVVVLAFGIAALFFYTEALAITRSITFPVSGTFSFRDDFAEPRGGGTREHLGIDIIAAKMTPVVAAVDGTVSFIAIPQASWGYALTIRDSEGYTYRYLHLNNDSPGTDDGQGGEANAYASGLRRGSVVTKGQLVGWVGDSGNAEEAVSHLHFEIRAPDRSTLNPYDTLIAASGGNSGTASTVVTHGVEGGIEAEELFIATRQLQEGMVDRDVATLHEQLKTAGYYSGAISEIYSSVTRESVRKFQNDMKITSTGIADALTRRTLETLLKTLPAPSVTISTSLSEGAQGEVVRALQSTLKELGYFKSDVTGYFGPLTRTAVVAFQNAKGIEPLGIVGPKTRAALDASSLPIAGSSYAFSTYLEFGMRGEVVKQLQRTLTKEGHFSNEVTGYFGILTRAAVIAFQNAEGIEPLGIVGPKTREALNSI